MPEDLVPWDRGRNVPYKERFAEWFRNPDNIEEEAKELGEEFARRFEVYYERVLMSDKDKLQKALKNSPLLVYIPVGCPKEDGIQQYCNKNISHAVSMPQRPENGVQELFDSYIHQPHQKGDKRFIRKVVSNYKYSTFGHACTIEEKNIDMPNRVIKGDKSTDLFELGKDGKLRHIPNEAVWDEGVAAGNWVERGKLETFPQSEVDAMPKGPEHAFTIN